MNVSNASTDKPSSKFSGRDLFGLLLTLGGLVLQTFWPRHSLQYDISFACIFAGLALQSFGTYLFVPMTLIVFAALLDLGEIKSHTPSHLLMALAVIIGVYGWWKSKKAKASDGGLV